jgi:hypothetical protein
MRVRTKRKVDRTRQLCRKSRLEDVDVDGIGIVAVDRNGGSAASI